MLRWPRLCDGAMESAMGETLVGLLSIAILAGFLFLAFRRSLPFNYRTRERSEINKHSSYGDTESGNS